MSSLWQRMNFDIGVSVTGRGALLASRTLNTDIVEIHPDSPFDEWIPKNFIAHTTGVSLFRSDFDLSTWINRVHKNLKGKTPKAISVHFGADWQVEQRLQTFLPIRPTSSQLQLAGHRLKELRDEFECDIGIENLALELSQENALRQIDEIQELCLKTDSFILLDLHNLYCQSKNFKMSLPYLLGRLDLARVKEIHVSGGSDYQCTEGTSFRRDTHNGPLPKELIELIPTLLPKLLNLKWIIYEALPHRTLSDYIETARGLAQIKIAIRSKDKLQWNDHKMELPVGLDPRALEVRDLLVKTWQIPKDSLN